jgi:predicted ATP-grasp superfamily ATP-dependent carboligase
VTPVPAVVVGGTLNALGVVRSLSLAERMPIYLLETTRLCSAACSRFVKFVRISAQDGPDLVKDLIALGRQLGSRPVLILTSDSTVNCVSEARGELEPLYRISLPSAEMVRVLGDKVLFQELAEREGFTVPRSVSLDDASNLTQIETLQPPLVIKPADKTLVLKGIAERAAFAPSLEEARSVGARMLARAHRVIFQEYIEGPDTEIYFTLFTCDDQGEVVGLFPGRKVLCSPPVVGNTAVCVAAPEAAAELVPPTLEFIRRVSYRGLGSMEFKRDRRNGRFVMVEPTVGRTDWQEEIATLCGVNLPLMTYRSALGQQMPGSRAAPAEALAWRSSIGFRTRLASGVRQVDGYFRWTDPLPALFYYGYERGIHRVWRRAMRGTTRS